MYVEEFLYDYVYAVYDTGQCHTMRILEI